MGALNGRKYPQIGALNGHPSSLLFHTCLWRWFEGFVHDNGREMVQGHCMAYFVSWQGCAISLRMKQTQEATNAQPTIKGNERKLSHENRGLSFRK
jgi:hypothetical protein